MSTVKRTENEYTVRAESCIARYKEYRDARGIPPADLRAFTDWLMEFVRKGKKPSTWRKYRASLVYYLEQRMQYDLAQSVGELPAVTRREFKAWVDSGVISKKNNTSSRKQKGVAEDQLELWYGCFESELSGSIVFELLKKSDFNALSSIDAGSLYRDINKSSFLLYFFTKANLHLGLRPSEWGRTVIKEQESGLYALIENGKNSNGRAFGKYRRLLLPDKSSEPTQDIVRFFYCVKKLNEIFQLEGSGDWESFFDRQLNKMAAKLLRMNTRLFKSNKQKIPTMYSTRHQCAANLKLVMDKAEVAAFMGHLSQDTAGNHYARKSQGRSSSGVRPHPEDVERVRQNPPKREFNPELFNQKKKPTMSPG